MMSSGPETVSSEDQKIRAKATLFVRKVPFDATDADFEAFFSSFGPLRSCFLVRQSEGDTADDTPPKNKGFGFVHFADASDASSALAALKKTKFNDRRLKAEFALRKSVKPDLVEDLKGKTEERPPQKSKQQRPAQSNILRLVLEGCTQLPDRKQIYKRMKKLGSVQDLILTEPSSVQVVFSSVAEAAKAADRLDGRVFKGYKMMSSVDPPTASLKAHRLIVRNLAFSAVASDLEAAFARFGPLALDRVSLGVRKDGKHGGYAFVQFLRKEDAERALMEITNSEIRGRTVAVDWALPKAMYDKVVSVDTEGAAEEGIPHTDASKAEESEANEPGPSEAIESDNSEETSLPGSTDTDCMERTVFVRNLGFDAAEQDLAQEMSRFGAIVSCKVVKNPATGLGKGTAFVEFKDTASAKLALSAKPLHNDQSGKKGDSDSVLVDLDALSETGVIKHAVPVLSGRPLIILPAVDRKAATRMAEQSSESYDRRHLSLVRESCISKYPRSYTPSQIREREALIKDRLRALKRDQNLFISPTRLSLRHLPLDVDDGRLKSFIKSSLAAASAPKTRIVQVKVVLDANDRRKRSKGFAFCQLDDHQAALTLVRHLCADPEGWKALGRGEGKVMPVIEFATEKASVVASREKRLRPSSVRPSDKKIKK